MVRLNARSRLPFLVAGLFFARAAICDEAVPDAAKAPPPPAEAAPDPAQNKAREEFEAGVTALREGRLIEAERSFRASLSSARRASALYNLALTLLKQGRYRESIHTAREIASDASLSADARYREDAEALVRRASASLATLRVSVRPTSALVRVDGELAQEAGAERSIVVDPGRHVLEVSAPGHLAVQHGVVLQGGTEIALVVSLTPLPSPSPAPTPDSAPRKTGATVAPWIVVGVGGALMAGGLVTGILAKQADDEFKAGCPALTGCDPSLADEKDRAGTLGNASDVLYVTGGAVAAAGLVWHFVLPSPSAPGRAALSVTGRF
jgi:hypothetical protein